MSMKQIIRAIAQSKMRAADKARWIRIFRAVLHIEGGK